MADLRIFSYLPNPRVWKATIAARFCGAEIEVRGAPGKELRNWLCDYDACPLNEDEQRALSSFARTGRVFLTILASARPAKRAGLLRSRARTGWPRRRCVRVRSPPRRSGRPSASRRRCRPATGGAEFGADVVRIDPPAPIAGPRHTMWFGLDVNQGKRALILDLKGAAQDGWPG
jgi:hypothetical protein